MRYIKTLGLITSAIILGLVFMANSASAQVRLGIPFGHVFYGGPLFVQGYYSPTYYSPEYYSPPYYSRYWLHTRKTEDKKSLEKAENRLEKDQLNYNDKGPITPKEQKQLDKDQYEIDRAQRRLDND